MSQRTVPLDSLHEFVGSHGALGLQEAFAIALDVADAASVLNWAGVIHRDISPSNIIVAADGAHLIDLGIARTYDEQATHDTTRLGTWGFAAPEQYGFAQTDVRVRLFGVAFRILSSESGPGRDARARAGMEDIYREIVPAPQ